jgi:hypothetical protein
MSRGFPMKRTSAWIVTLASKMSDVGPQIIECLPLSTHCRERERERERFSAKKKEDISKMYRTICLTLFRQITNFKKSQVIKKTPKIG